MTTIEWIIVIFALLLLLVETLTYIGWVAMKNAYIRQVMNICEELEKLIEEQKAKNAK